MTKKVLIVIVLGLVIGACSLFNQEKDIIFKKGTFPKNKIEYIEEKEDGKFIFTSEGKSYEVSKREKKELETTILGKFEKHGKRYYVSKKDGRIGILNDEMRQVIAYNYDEIENLGSSKFVSAKNKGKNYLINIYTYEMLGPYEKVTMEGNIISVVDRDKNKYLDSEGVPVVELLGKNILFTRGDMIVTSEDKKYGLLNLEKDFEIEPTNDEIYFAGDNIITKRYGEYFLNNEQKLDFTRIYPTTNEILIYDIGDNKFGLYDLEKNKKSIIEYEEISLSYHNYLMVSKNGKFAAISKYNDKEPDYKYAYMTPAGIDAFGAGIDESKGLFALIVGDKQVTEEKYEGVYSLVPDYYFGELEGKLYLINKNGKEILTTSRKDLIYYDNNLLIVREGEIEKIYMLRGDE